MQLLKNYMYYISAIKPDMCKKLISYGLSKMTVDEQKGISKRASTFDGKEKGGTDTKGNKVTNQMTGGATKSTLKRKGIDADRAYVRDSYVSWLNDKWIYDIFHPYIHHANKEAGWNWEWDFSESFQFTVYHGSEKQFYGWHADGSSDWPNAYKPAVKVDEKKDKDGKVKAIWKIVMRNQDGSIQRNGLGKPVANMDSPDLILRPNGMLPPGFTENEYMWDKVRKISMTVNLTNPDNYAGGNLKFDLGAHAGAKRYHICQEIRPTGSIIIFPSFVYHCVTPVTRGTRYSLVLWSLGKPFR